MIKRKVLLAATAGLMALSVASAALAQQRTFNIPSQDASVAIGVFGLQAGVQITAPSDQIRGVRTQAVRVIKEGDRVVGAVLKGAGVAGGPPIEREVRARVVIDATNDASFAARAGAGLSWRIHLRDPLGKFPKLHVRARADRRVTFRDGTCSGLISTVPRHGRRAHATTRPRSAARRSTRCSTIRPWACR